MSGIEKISAEHQRKIDSEGDAPDHVPSAGKMIDTIRTLTKYNEWRRTGASDMPDPKIIGDAIDTAIEALSALPVPPAYLELAEVARRARTWNENRAGESSASHWMSELWNALDKIDGAPSTINDVCAVGKDSLRTQVGDAPVQADKVQQEGDAVRLDFFRPSLELSHEWDDDESHWAVHRVSGGRNDREWTLIGKGQTVREAIDAAIASTKAGTKEPSHEVR